jgi:cell division protein FtsB
LLSTFERPLLNQAEQEGLIRPELKRAELIEWRRKRTEGADPRAEMRAKLERLRRERAKIEEEMRQLEQELAEQTEE